MKTTPTLRNFALAFLVHLGLGIVLGLVLLSLALFLFFET
jgi:hypothetical protein